MTTSPATGNGSGEAINAGISFTAGANMRVSSLNYSPRDAATRRMALWQNSDGTRLAYVDVPSGASSADLATPVDLVSGQAYTISVDVTGSTRVRWATVALSSTYFTTDVSNLALKRGTNGTFPATASSSWYIMSFVYEYYTPSGESYNGSFAISQSSTVIESGIKNSSGLLAVSNTSSVTTIATKKASGLFAIDQTSTIIIDGEVPNANSYNGEFAISQTSTVEQVGVKRTTGVLSISQDSTVVFLGSKITKAVNEILQGSSVVASAIKTSLSTFLITQTQTISAIGNKISNAISLIEQASTVATSGSRDLIVDYVAGFIIEQTSTITATAKKISQAITEVSSETGVIIIGNKRGKVLATISESSNVVSNVVKCGIGRIVITASDLVSALGKKITSGIYSISAHGEISYIWYTDAVLVDPIRSSVLFDRTSSGQASINIVKGTAEINTEKQSSAFGNTIKGVHRYDNH